MKFDNTCKRFYQSSDDNALRKQFGWIPDSNDSLYNTENLDEKNDISIFDTEYQDLPF